MPFFSLGASRRPAFLRFRTNDVLLGTLGVGVRICGVSNSPICTIQGPLRVLLARLKRPTSPANKQQKTAFRSERARKSMALARRAARKGDLGDGATKRAYSKLTLVAKSAPTMRPKHVPSSTRRERRKRSSW